MGLLKRLFIGSDKGCPYKIIIPDIVTEPVTSIYVWKDKLFVGTIYGRVLISDLRTEQNYLLSGPKDSYASSLYACDDEVVVGIGNSYFIRIRTENIKDSRILRFDKRGGLNALHVLPSANIVMIPTVCYTMLYNFSVDDLFYSTCRVFDRLCSPLCINKKAENKCQAALFYSTDKFLEDSTPQIKVMEIQFEKIQASSNYNCICCVQLLKGVKAICSSRFLSDDYVVVIDQQNVIYKISIAGNAIVEQFRRSREDIVILEVYHEYIITIDNRGCIRIQNETCREILRRYIKKTTFIYTSIYRSCMTGKTLCCSTDTCVITIDLSEWLVDTVQ